MNQQEKLKEREMQRELVNREELVERISRHLDADGALEPIKGLTIFRASKVTQPVYGVSMPSFCIIAQGCKEIFLGDKRYQYDPYSYLLATAELPIVSRVLEAGPDKPYLSLRLTLDPAMVGSVMVELGQSMPPSRPSTQAIEVSPLDTTLLDVVLRMVRLLDDPTEARLLLPSISREIIYRLLIGEQSYRLSQMTVMGGHAHRIAQAVEKIGSEFNQPLRVEDLARQVGMSVSGFHHHFKAVTAMSPLQFQKQLRLQEARRLMLSEEMDAASAGYRVGYDDASYFNREYKSFFGIPPRRDVESVRSTATATADV